MQYHMFPHPYFCLLGGFLGFSLMMYIFYHIEKTASWEKKWIWRLPAMAYKIVTSFCGALCGFSLFFTISRLF